MPLHADNAQKPRYRTELGGGVAMANLFTE
jgi:hypothetical protein